jgi:hypothetical protein
VHLARFTSLLALAVTTRAIAAPPIEAVTGAPAAAEAAAPPAPRPRDLSLRFAWPRTLEARVVYRRVYSRTGGTDRSFTARYREKAARKGAELRIASSGTRWEGEVLYPPGEVRPAIRASEAVVQRVGADGAFIGLENEDALRPVLQRIYDAAGLSEEESEEAIARVEAAMVEEARAGWNLAVGFWIGAELDFGKAWEKEVDAPVWILPALAVKSRVRMEARRRVPCTASERRARCVELTLHSEPDRAALPAVTRAIVAKLAGAGEALPAGEVREVGLATDLTLVTEPATLVPYRVVWRRAVRATVGDADGARELEDVERTEWSWTYLRRGPPVR